MHNYVYVNIFEIIIH